MLNGIIYEPIKERKNYIQNLVIYSTPIKLNRLFRFRHGHNSVRINNTSNYGGPIVVIFEQEQNRICQ